MSCSAEIRRCRPLLGTYVEIWLRGRDEARLHRMAEAGFAAVEQVQRLMSYHDPASELSRVNAAVVGERVILHPWTRAVLRAALRFSRVSDGVFDVTVAPQLAALGFLPPGGKDASGTWRDLVLSRDGFAWKRRPLRIDLGGIAKGFAVDRAVAALRAAGSTSGLVNAGGDLRAFGRDIWQVGIRHPARPGATAAKIALRAAALATSASTFTHRTHAGRRIGPFVNGVSRAPIITDRGVTVLASTCLLADALTKIVFARADASPLLTRHRARAFVLAADATLAYLPADAA